MLLSCVFFFFFFPTTKNRLKNIELKIRFRTDNFKWLATTHSLFMYCSIFFSSSFDLLSCACSRTDHMYIKWICTSYPIQSTTIRCIILWLNPIESLTLYYTWKKKASTAIFDTVIANWSKINDSGQVKKKWERERERKYVKCAKNKWDCSLLEMRL